MRFFQPHDYIAVDYATRYASISNLAPPDAASGNLTPVAWPGVYVRRLETIDVEPLRAEIEAFLEAAHRGGPPPVSGLEGRRALALALRALKRIAEHAAEAGINRLQMMQQ